MKEKVFNRLLTVKAIVTIILALVFAYLAITGKVDADSFESVFYIVVAFYFGSNLEKTANATNTKTE